MTRGCYVPLVMSATAREKEPDEAYCSSCGELIKAEAEICPECGVRQKAPSDASEKESRIGQKGYLGIGVVSALVSLVLFPPVFGLISVFSGYQTYKRWNETRGLALMAFGGVCMAAGIVIGIYTM